MKHLVMRFEGPLAAYGGERVDAFGPVFEFPLASTITGVIANALGWTRSEISRHTELQDSIRFACRIDRRGQRMRDFQTAQLSKDDKGWTTHGFAEGRGGTKTTYDSPHIRNRDYDADKSVVVVVQFRDGCPLTVEEIADALQTPARPLFLGRKPCLPSEPIFAGIVEAEGLTSALALIEPQDPDPQVVVQLPYDEQPQDRDEIKEVADLRNWRLGVHTGTRRVRIRTINIVPSTGALEHVS